MNNNLRSRLETLKDLVHDIVESGADSVEAINKAIADLPLEVLEKRGLLNEPGKNPRKAVDSTIGSVYDAIRKVNDEVTVLASEILSQVAEAGHETKAKKPVHAAHAKSKSA